MIPTNQAEIARRSAILFTDMMSPLIPVVRSERHKRALVWAKQGDSDDL